MTSGDDCGSGILIQELLPSLMLNVGVEMVALRSPSMLVELSSLLLLVDGTASLSLVGTRSNPNCKVAKI